MHLLSSASVAFGAISINSAATYTKSASVSVTLRAPSGYTQYALSNTTTVPATTTSLSTPVSWTLDSGDGAKTVYAQFFKADGTASGVYSASIMLDTTAPTIISAKSKGKSKVRVIFSEALATMPSASDFTITPALTISSITKESDTSYLLMLSTPSDTTSTYTLAASGITDVAGNAVASGSVTFDRKPIETIYLYHGSTRIAKKENGVTTYLLQDHLGSTVATADSTGKLLSRTTYTPYGSVATESGDTDSHKFTGKELDPSTGLYDYEARQYDAGLGRFISADTATPNYSDPQSLNRYSYCQNNPVKYIDPTGHAIETPFDLAALSFSVAAYVAAPGVLNFAAVAVDAFAAATPGLPAFGGMAIRGTVKAESALMHIAETGSVATAKNKAVFYSGPGNTKKAENFAKKFGLTRIDDTPGGQEFAAAIEKGNYSKAEIDAAGRRLSERYAEGASGKARAFSQGANPERIYLSTEKPALIKNSKIKKIIEK